MNLIAPGAIETECRDRYLWVSVDVGFTGHVPRFEAVGMMLWLDNNLYKLSYYILILISMHIFLSWKWSAYY